jgi:regulator of sigma E protease
MGVNFVGYQLWQVYSFLAKLADRSVSTRNVAGPVGIVGMAIEQAKSGLPDLMFFLAFLSVNLAVLNFLPMPVLDGGLMVFLLIEKIKGKPLSLKAQMVSTMVGLAVIIIGLLFVTIQDIGRFF